MAVTVDQIQAWRDAVSDRLARAEAADPGADPISHRLNEYRACIAELDTWVAEVTP